MHIYDIPKPVSQGEFGSLHTANSRMEKITDVLRRKTTCSIHDEKLQACTEADKGLLWKEQRIAEQIAKVNNCWYLGIINYSMKQQLIDNFPATADLIEAHLQNLGFKKTINNHWFNETFEIWDVVPKNAMTDINGTIYVIDAEIRKL